MIEHARARSTLARDGQVRVDRIEFQLVRDLSEELSFEMTEFGLDRPHQLNRIGDKRLERLESVVQFLPAVRRIEQGFESGLRPRRKNHANGSVAAGVGERVERDIDAV